MKKIQSNNCLKSILVGIEMGEVDKTLYSYVANLSNCANPDFISFLHVMPKPWNIKGGLDIAHPEEMTRQREIESSIFNAIKSNIELSKFNISKDLINIQIKMGDPLTQLLKYARSIEPALVVIGQKKLNEDRGILSRNILQKAVQNALVIPEGSTSEIKKILVPMDFSKYAIAAFQQALYIRKTLDIDVEITLLNIFESLNLHVGLHNTMENFMTLQKEEIDKEFEKLLSSYNQEDVKNVNTVFLSTKYNSIGFNISKYAKIENYDFIIMGAIGHSNVDLLMMGSVAERVLTNDLNCPVMIIKK